MTHKLVRDNILDIISLKNPYVKFHIAGQEEFTRKLDEKLLEEVKEYLASGELEEIADILEVIDAILAAKNIQRSTVEKLKRNKAEKKGKFLKKIILEE